MDTRNLLIQEYKLIIKHSEKGVFCYVEGWYIMLGGFIDGLFIAWVDNKAEHTYVDSIAVTKLNLDQTIPQTTVGTFTFQSIEVDIPNPNTKGIILKASSSQSDNILEVKNDLNQVLCKIDNNGIIRGQEHGNITTLNNSRMQFTDNGTIISRNVANSDTTLIINQLNTSSTGKVLDVQFGSVSKTSFDKDGIITSQGNVVNTPNATTKGIVVKLFTGQTANGLEVQDSTNAILAKIASNGNITGSSFIGTYAFLTSAVNSTSVSNSEVNLSNTGAKIIRNIADSNPACITRSIQGTGNIHEFVQGSTTVAALGNGGKTLQLTQNTPASTTATGTIGQACWDTAYIYICTATNTWKRVAIATW